MKRFVVAFAAILAGTAYGALPTPIIDLGFNEGAGTVAANSGSAGGTLTLSTPVPTWSTNVPPGVGGASSVDFATTTGNYFIESPANYAELTGLTKFTVTGWANCRNSTEGSGGNRLVTWINHGGQGVDVVYKSDGSVQVGINQWPDGVPARSSAGKITTDAGAGAGNWCFFAVTYDSTLSSGHVKFYFGRTPGDAAFDVERNYARGAVGTNISRLCIGHFNVATRAGAQNRMFRGLIDEVKVFGEALTLEQIRAVQIGNPEIAGGADPAGSAQDVPTDVVLSWQPGQFARTHDVYFGTSLADVETASRQSPKGVLVSQGQSSTAYDPAGLLAFGQTYYWRIDEVNAPPSNTIFKGNVWSFTTEPYAYPIASVTATASSSDKASTGPEKTVNGSGLTNDLHSTVGEAMWLSSMAGAQPAWIQYRFDRVYKLYELWVWNHNTEYEPLLGFGFKDVAIEYSLDGTTWTLLKETQFAKAPAANGYAHNTAVDLGGVTAQHVRLIARSNWSTVGLKQYGLSEVRFFHVPIAARAPQPANGAAGLALDTVLSWRPGRDVVSHRVYFGTDKAAVTDGTVAAVTATERRYTPAALALDTTYFWRVDEVGTAGTYPGDVWNFSTAKFLVVDDFETYTDAEGSRIYEAWVDGYGTTTNGAQVGNLQAPFAERTIIQGGKQAMPLTYDNAAGKISETTRTFEAAQDWTAHGVKSLSLWFYGDPANAGQLYVKIDNTKVLYNGEAVDLKRRQWQPWNIDLAAVGGVSKVTKLTIGIEGAGATGKLYLDSIHLYPRVPEFLTPVEPVRTGLLAEYLFNNGANDTSGNGHHGRFLGEARVGDSVLLLDGTDDAVAIPRLGGATATHRQCTYSMWMYSSSKPVTSAIIGGINSDGWSAGGIHCKLYNGRANAGINGLAGGDLNGTTIVEADEWVHLALTVTDSIATIYLNGQAEASRSFATPLTMILGNGCIGAWNNNGDIQRELKGKMDDVRIYNRALSAEEMLWLAGRKGPVHKPF